MHPIFTLMVHSLLMDCDYLFMVFSATFPVLSLFLLVIVFITLIFKFLEGNIPYFNIRGRAHAPPSPELCCVTSVFIIAMAGW